MPTVLIVEDHEDTREMVVELLGAEGYELLEAEHGQQALDILSDASRARPDVVLLDMAMPVMGGGELLEILDERGMLASLPVIVLSASIKPSEAKRARAFLRKPPNLSELLAAIRAQCPDAPASP